MLPETVIDQIKAVKNVIDAGVTAGGGIQGSVDLASDLPGSVEGSMNIADALGN